MPHTCLHYSSHYRRNTPPPLDSLRSTQNRGSRSREPLLTYCKGGTGPPSSPTSEGSPDKDCFQQQPGLFRVAERNVKAFFTDILCKDALSMPEQFVELITNLSPRTRRPP